LHPAGGRELLGRRGLFGLAKTETTLFTVETVLFVAGTVGEISLAVMFLAKTWLTGVPCTGPGSYRAASETTQVMVN